MPSQFCRLKEQTLSLLDQIQGESRESPTNIHKGGGGEREAEAPEGLPLGLGSHHYREFSMLFYAYNPSRSFIRVQSMHNSNLPSCWIELLMPYTPRATKS